MTASSVLGQSVLAFWRAIEYLTPASPDDATHKSPRPPIEQPKDREGVWDITTLEDLPWGDGLKAHYGQTDKEVWFFVLTVGFSPVDDAMDELRQLLGHLPDDAERPGGGGDMALASVVVDARGVYGGAAAVSPMPWAMGKLRAGEHPSTLEGFDDFEQEAVKGLETLLTKDTDEEDKPKPLTLDSFKRICAEVGRIAGWSPRRELKLLARIKAVKLTVRKDGSVAEVEPDILGSFIAADLTRVRRALARGDVGAALTSYLFGRAPGIPRTDVIERPELAARWLSPSLHPAGRWPSKPLEQLVTAQQMAVNAAFGQLKDASGLFSVNGPPGTGKTTLLRDMVAAILVERAKVLVRLDKPSDAFHDAHAIGQGTTWRLDDSLKGFEIVVASTNNGAVENVTFELPGVKAIDSAWSEGRDHFSAVARTLLDPEPGESEHSERSVECWGLIAAVLGNRRNRKRFAERFWWAEPGRKNFHGKPQPDHWQNFKVALDQLGRMDWRKAKAAFQKSLDDVERSLKAARELDAALQRHRAIAEVKANWDKLERDLDGHLALRPPLLHLLLRPWAWLNWLRRRAVYRDLLDTMTQGLLDLGGHVKGRGLGALVSRMTTLRRLEEQGRDEIRRLCQGFSGVAVDETFFAMDKAPREMAIPWIDKAADEARKRCFMAALDLHRAFLAGAKSNVKANLGLASDLLKGKLTPPECGEYLGDLWGTLFLAVPLVSTTFASFARLFEGMGRESLGWLLVDEAGQATPQAAAGAIWRARRAVVIGDPLQIEPVVPLPLSVIKVLEERFGLEHRWHPVDHSAQVLADEANPLGGWIGKTWVGSPLRVHRRCSDPMFTVSNAIAYDNLMVHGDVPREVMPLGPSRWLDLRGMPDGEGHYIPDQGEAVLSLLRQAHRDGVLHDVFVISPFRTVAQGMKDAAERANLPESWIKTKIGTVHTFQGKEAKMVILLLGGHPNRPGALVWAESKPNLLNVALTRAKRAIYVVGDREKWGKLTYFETLARELG